MKFYETMKLQLSLHDTVFCSVICCVVHDDIKQIYLYLGECANRVWCQFLNYMKCKGYIEIDNKPYWLIQLNSYLFDITAQKVTLHKSIRCMAAANDDFPLLINLLIILSVNSSKYQNIVKMWLESSKTKGDILFPQRLKTWWIASILEIPLYNGFPPSSAKPASKLYRHLNLQGLTMLSMNQVYYVLLQPPKQSPFHKKWLNKCQK